jgi:catechol 2,3-dioxygenase-like lactoylglutathione lyase family enzyme
MITGLAHVDLVCRDVQRSIRFYLDVLAPLGLQEPVTFDGERGETIHYLRFPQGGSIGLREATGDGADLPFALYAPGLHHLAFAVEAQEDVHVAHERAVEAGAEILHPPTPFPEYHPAYYATFFLDPDDFRVEVRSR